MSHLPKMLQKVMKSHDCLKLAVHIGRFGVHDQMFAIITDQVQQKMLVSKLILITNFTSQCYY